MIKLFNYFLAKNTKGEINPYLNLIKLFLIKLGNKINLIKKNFIKFKSKLLKLSFIKWILIVYFFFIGVIPIIIIILFWLFIIYYSLFLMLLLIEFFFFKTLLLYTNDNINVKKSYILYCKIEYNILFFFEYIYNKMIIIIYWILNLFSFNWWYNHYKLYVVKPLDKLMCLILEKITVIIIKSIKKIKKIIIFFINYLIRFKDNIIYVYIPNMKKLIIKVKLLKFKRFNIYKYTYSYVYYLYFYLYFIRLFINKWFWLYFLNFYLFDIYIRKHIISFKYLLINKKYWLIDISQHSKILLNKILNYEINLKIIIKYYFINIKYKILFALSWINIKIYNKKIIIIKNIINKIIINKISVNIITLNLNLNIIYYKILYIIFKLQIILILKYI